MEKDIVKSVHVLRVSFFRSFGKVANVVYMGHEEMDTLKRNHARYLAHDFPEKPQVFGLPIKRVDEKYYLSVGYVLEEYNQ
jgi:hypothetical protein